MVALLFDGYIEYILMVIFIITILFLIFYSLRDKSKMHTTEFKGNDYELFKKALSLLSVKNQVETLFIKDEYVNKMTNVDAHSFEYDPSEKLGQYVNPTIVTFYDFHDETLGRIGFLSKSADSIISAKESICDLLELSELETNSIIKRIDL